MDYQTENNSRQKENLAALKETDEKLWKAFLEWKKQKQEKRLLLEEGVSRTGEACLWVEKNGNRSCLTSSYNPERQAREWCCQFSLHSVGQVVLLFGLGSGSFVKELLRQGGKDLRLLIYEPSVEIFAYGMERLELSGWLREKRVNLLVEGLNGEQIYNELNLLISWENLGNSIYAVHPRYEQLFPEQYQDFLKAVRDGWVRAEINRNTHSYFSKDLVKNTFCTLEKLRHCQFLEQYCSIFPAGVPAIIVAAGPSLDRNIDKLQAAKGRAVIFATDTAVRDLVKHGIQADFIVTIDARKPVSYLEAEECKDIPIIYYDYANREILREHRGKHILCAIDSLVQSMRPSGLPELALMNSGGSVATCAFAMCYAIGFRRIILVGQDLAYRDGISHAGGRMSGEETKGDWLIEVEDIYGQKIQTRGEWYQFLRWFEETIASLKGEIEVIDATEGGARIHGTRLMKLEEAIAVWGYDSIDCQQLVEKLGDAYTQASYGVALQKMEQALLDNEKNIKESQEMIDSAERLLTLCERKQYGKEYKRLAAELVKKGRRIEKRLISSIVEDWIATEGYAGLSGISTMEEDIEKNEKKTYQAALSFYQKLQEGCRELMPLLENTYREMKLSEV